MFRWSPCVCLFDVLIHAKINNGAIIATPFFPCNIHLLMGVSYDAIPIIYGHHHVVVVVCYSIIIYLLLYYYYY
jgi:hypothetical protein